LFRFAVHKMRSFLFYLLPVIFWMVLIFGFSGDGASFQHSSRIIGPLVRWLFPKLSPAAVNDIIFAVRKCAHLTEYAILALLVWRARHKCSTPDAKRSYWPTAGVALWTAILYAATDEFHQTFVPTREGCLRDVLIDSTGAVAGLFALWLLGRWRKAW
jgi:VanZ family protein